MKKEVRITPLTKDRFGEAVQLILEAELDSREEIEHHLSHLDTHYVALDGEKIVGVIGWYQDNVNYATKAMGDKFPGEEACWVGFFAIDKEYRGQGIGFSLLQKLEEVVKKKKAFELWVSSVPQTKNYYQRQGFKLMMEGEINGHPKCFMVKTLTNKF